MISVRSRPGGSRPAGGGGDVRRRARCRRVARRLLLAGLAAVSADGLIVVDKSGGMTSHDVVARIRRLAR
ncbi:hypothetical protein ACFQZ8_30355, partial [Micromonospora azadirachtae]